MREHICGYDCTRFECRWGRSTRIPGIRGSHGAAGVAVCFVVNGDDRAVQFILLQALPWNGEYQHAPETVSNWLDKPETGTIIW